MLSIIRFIACISSKDHSTPETCGYETANAAWKLPTAMQEPASNAGLLFIIPTKCMASMESKLEQPFMDGLRKAALMEEWTRRSPRGPSPVQKAEQGSTRHELGHDAEVGRQSAGAHEENDIWMFEPLHD